MHTPPPVRQSLSQTEITDEDLLPVERLIVLTGEMEGRSVAVLKDDDCNTNVVSKEFVNHNPHLFDLRECNISVTHSKKDSTEHAHQLILNGTLCIGSHYYVSNWAVADCRYDVLLGMPWHKEMRPVVDYAIPSVVVDGEPLPQASRKGSVAENVQVTNLGVKKFRSLLRKKREKKDFSVFQLVQANHLLA